MPTRELEAHELSMDPHTGYMLESVLKELGDLVVAAGPSNPDVLPVSTPGYILMVSFDTPTRPIWKPVGLIAIPNTAFINKGDLLVGTGSGTFAVLSVGPDGWVLVPDSTSESGLSWVDPDVLLCYFGLDFSLSCDSGYVGLL